MSIDNKELKAKLHGWGMDYYKRQTGRTTRMFEAAKALAESGKPVTVLMKDERSADCWRERGWEVPGLEIISMNARESRVDWYAFKMTDHRANNELFIDHDVLYIQFKDALKAFTQYDDVVNGIPEHVQKAIGVSSTKIDSVDLSAQEEALAKTRLLSGKGFGHLSFLEYEEVVEEMLSIIARKASIEETENIALFCYSLGKLKHKLLDDWRSNYGSAVAG